MIRIVLFLLFVAANCFLEPAFGDDGVLLAVGYGGRRMISTDGLKWEITAEWSQPGGDDSNNLMSAVFAQDKFVVVGGGGGGATGGGHILVSRDGREWKETFTDKGRINPIAYGNGRFVAGASAWPSGKLIWSTDAEKWNEGAKIQEKGLSHHRQGAFGNGVFVIVGNGSRPTDDGKRQELHWSITSPDGEKILGERNDLPGHGTIVFGAERFLMLTSHHQADVIASRDGLAWEKVDVAEGAKLNWLVWTGEEFLVGDGKQVHRSADGKTWQPTELTFKGEVKWSDGKRFVAGSWPGKMYYSADGKQWHDSPPLTANGINRVVYGKVK